MIDQSTMTIQDKISQYVQGVNVHSHPIFNSDILTQSLQTFQKEGLPTTKNEEWKFTNIHPFLKGDIQIHTISEDYIDVLGVNDLLMEHLHQIKAQMKGEEKGAYRLVIVDGKVSSELSYLPSQEILSISSMAANEAQEYGNVLRTENNTMAALNTIMSIDGIHLKVAANQQVDLPLHIIHLYTATVPTWYTDRMYIQLAQFAELSIIETYVCASNTANIFVNSACEVMLGTNAQCKHYDIQKTAASFHQLKRTEASQGLHSNYANYTFNLPGGKLFRNNLAIHIDHPDTHCHLYGLYLTNEQQLVDNHSEVHHKFPNCESNQVYKGVLLDESKAVFNGKIFVYQDAQKTNAFQKSNNLLLSDKATINAKPQLEIFADDVKCSHGSTIGQLDESAMFYLRSRGIGQETVKKMLVTAFAFDVAEKVENAALRHYLEEQIAAEIN